MVDAGDSTSAVVATATTIGVGATTGDAAVVAETPETGAPVTITVVRTAITNVVSQDKYRQIVLDKGYNSNFKGNWRNNNNQRGGWRNNNRGGGADSGNWRGGGARNNRGGWGKNRNNDDNQQQQQGGRQNRNNRNREWVDYEYDVSKARQGNAQEA